MVQSTCAPLTARPAASVALTTSGLGNGNPTRALWLLPETMASAEAAAARAVSVNETVTDGASCSAALIEAGPATEPTVYSTCAVPSEPVVDVAAPSTPPPETIVQSTCAPLTARPAASVAFTTRGFVSGSPTRALWLLPETIASALATAARAVSVNDTVTDGASCSAALIEAGPAPGPPGARTCPRAAGGIRGAHHRRIRERQADQGALIVAGDDRESGGGGRERGLRERHRHRGRVVERGTDRGSPGDRGDRVEHLRRSVRSGRGAGGAEHPAARDDGPVHLCPAHRSAGGVRGLD